jgi:hypothetical protein
MPAFALIEKVNVANRLAADEMPGQIVTGVIPC